MYRNSRWCKIQKKKIGQLEKLFQQVAQNCVQWQEMQDPLTGRQHLQGVRSSHNWHKIEELEYLQPRAK